MAEAGRPGAHPGRPRALVLRGPEGQDPGQRSARSARTCPRRTGRGGLQVDFRGAHDLTTAIRLASRRIAVGLAAATAIVGTAVTASAVHTATWATVVFSVMAALLTGGLLIDVVRGR